MASIRDVAKKAKVAPCTVSRVLNGTTNVTEDTRQRIELAMKELNYIPNELARSMFRKKSGIIAMLVPDIRHPYFSSLANYIEKELYQKNYKMMLCSTGDTVEREEEYLEILRSNLVDGVIMGVNRLNDAAYTTLDKPIIMLDYKVDAQIPVVVSNHTMGGKIAAQKFIDSGCKVVLDLLGKADKKVLSLQGHTVLKDCLEQAGIRSISKYVEWNAYDFDEYLKLAKEVLCEVPQIDGFMGADMPAIAFLQAAMELGKKVPEDFAVVAYDGTYVVNLAMKSITVIKQPLKEIAKTTVCMMDAMLVGNLPELPYVELDVELRQGETTK